MEIQFEKICSTLRNHQASIEYILFRQRTLRVPYFAGWWSEALPYVSYIMELSEIYLE